MKTIDFLCVALALTAGARKLAGLALHIERLTAGTQDRSKLIDVLVEGVSIARSQRAAYDLWAKEFVGSKKTDAADLETASFLAFATARGIREGYRTP